MRSTVNELGDRIERIAEQYPFNQFQKSADSVLSKGLSMEFVLSAGLLQETAFSLDLRRCAHGTVLASFFTPSLNWQECTHVILS